MTSAHEQAERLAAMEAVHARDDDEDRDMMVIIFEDQDRPMEVFTRTGAIAAAHRRYAQVRKAWSCHLFQRIAGEGA